MRGSDVTNVAAAGVQQNPQLPDLIMYEFEEVIATA